MLRQLDGILAPPQCSSGGRAHPLPSTQRILSQAGHIHRSAARHPAAKENGIHPNLGTARIEGGIRRKGSAHLPDNQIRARTRMLAGGDVGDAIEEERVTYNAAQVARGNEEVGCNRGPRRPLPPPLPLPSAIGQTPGGRGGVVGGIPGRTEDQREPAGSRQHHQKGGQQPSKSRRYWSRGHDPSNEITGMPKDERILTQ